MKKLAGIILVILIMAVAATAGYIIYDSSRVVTVEYTYASPKVPKNFDSYRIGVISDFHNSDNYEKIHKAFREAKPDIICVTGDLVDMNTTDFTNAVKLMEGLTEITDVYYVYGNHEIWSNSENGTETPLIKDKLEGLNIHFLNDSVKTIEKNGELINLVGYGDSLYDDTGEAGEIFRKKAKEKTTKLYNTLDKTVLSVLLFHRGQYFDMLAETGYDIVLAGHLHGGIVNIKGIREYILSTHFGADKYLKGEYKIGNSTMFLSSGIANRKNVPRIFNTSEINIVELKTK